MQEARESAVEEEKVGPVAGPARHGPAKGGERGRPLEGVAWGQVPQGSWRTMREVSPTLSRKRQRRSPGA